MKKISKLFFCFCLIVFQFVSAIAQTTDTTSAMANNPGGENEMADVLRSNGKIYVVVAVLLIILIGLIIFLISIDRKVSRLEKKNKNNP